MLRVFFLQIAPDDLNCEVIIVDTGFGPLSRHDERIWSKAGIRDFEGVTSGCQLPRRSFNRAYKQGAACTSREAACSTGE